MFLITFYYLEKSGFSYIKLGDLYLDDFKLYLLVSLCSYFQPPTAFVYLNVCRYLKLQ